MVYKRPNSYTTLSAAIRYENSLSPLARLIYSDLQTSKRYRKEYNPSDEFFAQMYQKSLSTIKRSIRSLRQEGYIITEGRGKGRIIDLVKRDTN